MERIFFDGWSVLFRTAVVGVLAYVCLIFFLRISGKRTLSKMNAFDFVVTVALGSTLATILRDQTQRGGRSFQSYRRGDAPLNASPARIANA